VDLTSYWFKGGLDRHPIGFDRVSKMVVAAGYRGSMSLEYETESGGEGPLTGMPKVLSRMEQRCERFSEPPVRPLADAKDIWLPIWHFIRI
jgi:hypothetical protein